MTTNVLLGIGGTGARVVEAALHLFLAGVGSSRTFNKVVIGLIDQDNANGNVERTRHLLADIERVRADWTNPKSNRLDWYSDPASGGVLFERIELEPLFPTGPHWRPTADERGTLAQILDRAGLDQDQKTLFDMLFTPGSEEQEMPLGEGYRGRAHVGAAAMLASLELEEGVFKDRITDLMSLAKQDQDVRIFLVGSVFGGTGASGFPILSRTLNAIRKDRPSNAQGQIRLGGALMLPYFGFNDPEDDEANVVRSSELMPQARVALEYYHRLFEREAVFDRFYVLGWNRFFQLGYHEPGNRGQRNPPMPPELLGALAAVDFFTTAMEPPADKVKVMVCAREQKEEIGWRDLPCISDDQRRMLNDRIGSFLRFALYWRFVVEPSLDHRNWLGGVKTPWMRDLTSDVDFKVDTPDARARLSALLDQFLVWAASMRLFSGTTGEPLNFDLWNTDDLEQRADRRDPTNPVSIKPTMASAAVAAAFDRAVIPGDPEAAPRRASDLFEEVSEPRLRAPFADNKGLGRMLAAVHRAARLF